MKYNILISGFKNYFVLIRGVKIIILDHGMEQERIVNVSDHILRHLLHIREVEIKS